MSHFFNYQDRLAQFRRNGGDRDAWEERWSTREVGQTLAAYRSAGRLDDFQALFAKYIPKELPVLEAGCGVGQLVAGLASRGYRVEGVDYASDTVARIREAAPDLNVRVCDVREIDAPDGTYGAYISIGVLEHAPDGPMPGLREARRVLRPDGVALISVPYLNRPRERALGRARAVATPEAPDGASFYQYYFSRGEFAALLDEAGFDLVDQYPYAMYAGLTRDYALGVWLHRKRFFFWGVHRRVTRWCRDAPRGLRDRWAHMCLYVCKPAARSSADGITLRQQGKEDSPQRTQRTRETKFFSVFTESAVVKTPSAGE